MKFLAVSPGVHAIDTLTLTDIESGFSMNLRCVSFYEMNILLIINALTLGPSWMWSFMNINWDRRCILE